MNFGTLGHYAVNKVSGANDAVVAWLVERDPDGMSVAEIDAQLSKLTTLSVEVSKAHTKSDSGKAAYDAAVKQNAVRLRAAENMQKKIDTEPAGPNRSSMEAALAEHLASLEADQEQLDSLKKVYESAKNFYEYLDRLFNEKGDRLKTMRAKLAIAANTMKTAKTREEQAKEQERVVKSVVGGSSGVDKFAVALSAMQKSATAANERTEAAERMVKKLTADPAKDSSFVAEAMAEASCEHAPPTAAADRIAALKARATEAS